MRSDILLVDVVCVDGDDEGDVEGLAQAHESLIRLDLLRQGVGVDLQVETLTEDLLEACQSQKRLILLAVQDAVVQDRAPKAGRRADDPLAVLLQHLPVESGVLASHARAVGLGGHRPEVLETRLVGCDQHEVPVVVQLLDVLLSQVLVPLDRVLVGLVRLGVREVSQALAPVVDEVGLQGEDGLEAVLVARGLEVRVGSNVAVVSDPDVASTVRLDLLGDLVRARKTIEQAVLRMIVDEDEPHVFGGQLLFCRHLGRGDDLGDEVGDVIEDLPARGGDEDLTPGSLGKLVSERDGVSGTLRSQESHDAQEGGSIPHVRGDRPSGRHEQPADPEVVLDDALVRVADLVDDLLVRGELFNNKHGGGNLLLW